MEIGNYIVLIYIVLTIHKYKLQYSLCMTYTDIIL